MYILQFMISAVHYVPIGVTAASIRNDFVNSKHLQYIITSNNSKCLISKELSITEYTKYLNPIGYSVKWRSGYRSAQIVMDIHVMRQFVYSDDPDRTVAKPEGICVKSDDSHTQVQKYASIDA